MQTVPNPELAAQIRNVSYFATSAMHSTMHCVMQQAVMHIQYTVVHTALGSSRCNVTVCVSRLHLNVVVAPLAFTLWLIGMHQFRGALCAQGLHICMYTYTSCHFSHMTCVCVQKLLTIVGLGSIGTLITVVGYCFFPTSILQ